MIEVYVEIEYAVDGATNFDSDFEIVSNATFEADQASENVFDVSPGADFSKLTVIFTCFAKGESIQGAVLSAETLVRESIKDAGVASWKWSWTKAYEPALNYENELYSSMVAA